MLIDDVTITIQAGNGGNGSVHFLRNSHQPKGGPDGGNGGNGGDIYIQGVDDIMALQQFQYKKEIHAEDGVRGSGQNMYGRNGKDLVLQIPLGTTIVDNTTDEVWEVTDTTSTTVLVKGGKGGRGNNEFKTATNQTPTYAEQGEEGQKRILHLQLGIIADIGFIGLPNAGKSSLLKVLTNADPKIGDYPFTTLEPNLGVLVTKEKTDKHIVLADIPGLIEGASKGKGLGIKFLKHVEKTKILFHCIDSSDRHALDTYYAVRKEIEQFSQTLAAKPEVILVTKIDLVTEDDVTNVKKDLKKTKKEILTVSIYAPKTILLLEKLIQSHA